jgi:hypothetical protein
MKYIILCLMVSSSLFAFHNDQKLEKKYFKLLDYQDPAKRPEIFKLEAHLIKKAKDIISFMEKNPDYKPTKKQTTKEEMGMIMAYTALFMMNNNNGYIKGDLSFDEIISQTKLTKADDQKLELYERYELADKFFEVGEKLAPEDDRISGWHLAEKFKYQKFRHGKVSEQVLDDLIELVGRLPIFHLYNALTMRSDYSFGPERDKKLFEINKVLSGADSPCNSLPFMRKGEAKRCSTTDRTPFAVPGVMTYMGDVYLRESQLTDSTEKSREYLDTAFRLYKMPKYMKPIKTLKWQQKKGLDERIQFIRDLRAGKKFDPSFYQTDSFLNVYTCNSCHQNGNAHRALKVIAP